MLLKDGHEHLSGHTVSTLRLFALLRCNLGMRRVQRCVWTAVGRTFQRAVCYLVLHQTDTTTAAGGAAPLSVARRWHQVAVIGGGSSGLGLPPSGRSPWGLRAPARDSSLCRPRAVLPAQGEHGFKLTRRGPGLWGLAVETFQQTPRKIQVQTHERKEVPLVGLQFNTGVSAPGGKVPQGLPQSSRGSGGRRWARIAPWESS